VTAAEDANPPISQKDSWVGIVDDDASLRTALARVLRGNGIRTETFESAEEFLARVDPGEPDCLVLDIHLAGISGFELQDLLASRGAEPPVIFITGHDDELAQRAQVHGTCGYLRKPFDTKALLALLRPHLHAALVD
jgi:two-component system, LuxR family, response regulator FixJ